MLDSFVFICILFLFLNWNVSSWRADVLLCYCYMVRNIHHVNDLVECGSEERDSAEDGSHVSSLESRVTGSAVH